jgi:alkylation response protein AidB-like acyl-CoA dehydrogenase
MEFAKGEFDPDLALDLDRDQVFPGDLLKKAAELGFTGMEIPESYGGQELGALDSVLVIEAFCREDSGFGTALGLADMAAPLILQNGSEEQKTRLLPPLARGERILSPAFLEKGRLSRPMEATASRNGDGYHLTGVKDFIPFAGVARDIAVFCQTGADPSSHQSLFLVEAGTGGLDISVMGDKVGMRMIPMGQMALDGLRVPEARRMGPEGEGAHILMNYLMRLGVKIGAMALGMAQGALDRALDYAGKREQFGRPIIRFDAVRNRLAEMRMQVETLRPLVYKAAWLMDDGPGDPLTLLTARVMASRTALSVTSDAVQIFGGYGYMKEGHVERFYRDARSLDLFLEPGTAARDRVAQRIAGREG